MFGLTRREQRWKAEQQAAETLVALIGTVVNAQAQVQVAEAQAEQAAKTSELEELRAEIAALRAELKEKSQA